MEQNKEKESQNENKIINEKSPLKYIDKIYKFITKENREIIGNLKAFNKDGNFYLIDCVEVFDIKGNNFPKNDLFNNSAEHQFYYETENFQYQYINNCIFPAEEIGDILMLKDEVYDKYKTMLDKFYEEKRLKEIEMNKEKENEIIEKENKENEKDINDEILENINKEKKKGKKRRKKKK